MVAGREGEGGGGALTAPADGPDTQVAQVVVTPGGPARTSPAPTGSGSARVICLTGGPCGGKTSAMSILSDLFESLGYRVYRVCETATVLLGGGVVFADLSPSQAYSFQRDLLRVMLSIEDTYVHLARLDAAEGRKAIVLCDRGAMDPSAYMPRDEWLRMLRELGLDEIAIRDHRYDVVVHLVSAAKGAEQFYSSSSNEVRSEGLELARELDTKSMNAWIGHSSFQVIDNVSITNFKEKLDKVVQSLLTRLGIVPGMAMPPSLDPRSLAPTTTRLRKHKYVVLASTYPIPGSAFPVPYRDFLVTHTYLINTTGDGTQTRIRRREELLAPARDGAAAHAHQPMLTHAPSPHLTMTIRRRERDGQRIETRRNLTTREYEALCTQAADPSKVPIRKERRCFLFKDRYFQMDRFLERKEGPLVLLEGYLDLQPGREKESLPDWLELREVTDDPAYSLFSLATRHPPSP